MDLGLNGRVAIVTGASRGIGRATAFALAKEGTRLCLVARGADALASTVHDIEKEGGLAYAVVADVTAQDAGRTIVEQAMARFGALDIVIANVGGSSGPRDFASTTGEDWDATYRLSVLPSINLLRAAVPYLAASDAASTIFIASVSGSAPQSTAAHYAAAKAALIHAARSLAWELGPQRIRVNALSPGSTIFPGGNWERREREQTEAFAQFTHSEFPWGRLGTPEEIADAVAFLASPRARGINATDMHVDGGQRKPSM